MAEYGLKQALLSDVGRAGLMHKEWTALYSRYSPYYTADIHYVGALVDLPFGERGVIAKCVAKGLLLHTGESFTLWLLNLRPVCQKLEFHTHTDRLVKP